SGWNHSAAIAQPINRICDSLEPRIQKGILNQTLMTPEFNIAAAMLHIAELRKECEDDRLAQLARSAEPTVARRNLQVDVRLTLARWLQALAERLAPETILLQVLHERVPATEHAER